MPSKRLSDFTLQKLQPPEKGQVEYWDPILKGFGVRVSYSGTKAWVVSSPLSMYHFDVRFPVPVVACLEPDADGYDCIV